jgi:hypothetical protein
LNQEINIEKLIYVVLDATLRLRVAESVKKVENDEKMVDKNQGSSTLP